MATGRAEPLVLCTGDLLCTCTLVSMSDTVLESRAWLPWQGLLLGMLGSQLSAQSPAPGGTHSSVLCSVSYFSLSLCPTEVFLALVFIKLFFKTNLCILIHWL